MSRRIPQHISSSNERFTPPEVIEAARQLLGGFDVDPASCAVANRTVGAERYYSLENDGLVQPWSGRVWLNPPGGKDGNKSQTVLFMRRLFHEWLVGNVESAVFLAFSISLLQSGQSDDLPSPTEFPFCVPRRRIAFFGPVGHDGVEVLGNPTHANALLFLPSTGGADDRDRFERCFAPHGTVTWPDNFARVLERRQSHQIRAGGVA